MRRVAGSVCAAALLLIAPPARAQAQARAQPPAQSPPAKQTFTVTRATSPVKVDGVLDEEAWKTAAVVP